MTNLLEEHIKTANETDEALYLGRLVWYSVSDVRASHAVVIKGLVDAGLGGSLPAVPKDFDVFRRVSSNAQRKKCPVPGTKDQFHNYLIREVDGRGKQVVVRRIVRETVDHSGKKLEYTQLRDLEFDRGTSLITVTDLPPNAGSAKDVIANEITLEVRAEFHAWRGMLTSYAIREYLRKTLLGLGATCVRDGVYFIAEDKADKVIAVENFANGVNGSEFHSLPLLDDSKQREMIRRAFEAETQDAIDTMMADIKETRDAGKKITSDKYAEIITRFQELSLRTKEYEGLLETALDQAHSRLSLFQTAIVNFREHVKD